MAIGVDYNLFWELTPKELEPFKKAFELSNTFKDISNWELGKYIQMAIGSVISKSVKYPNKPFHYNEKLHNEKQMISEEEQLKRERERIQWIKYKMMKRAKYINPILEQRMATQESRGGEKED